MNKEALLHLLGTITEYSVQHPIGNEWTCHEVFAEIQAIAVDFLHAHGQRWLELSKETSYSMHRYLPNAEESQHMVYAVSIEIACHILEATYPPLTTVLYHLVPVVGREPPILPIGTEIVWWSTGLSVHVEITGFHLHVTPIAVHTNGDVAFQHHTQCTGMLMGKTHLGVQNKLHVTIEIGTYRSLIRPHACIPADAIVGITCQPEIGFLKEGLICLGALHLGKFLPEYKQEVFPLGLVYCLIVYLW